MDNRARRIPPLSFLYFYVAGMCNLKCKHCWITPGFLRGKKYIPEVSISEYMNLVEQALPLGLKTVKLSGGEPFIRDDLAEFIESLDQNDIHVVVETNATLITEEIAALLAKVNATVSVSIDGATEETHDHLRGVKGALEETLEGIEKFRRHGVRFHPIMAIYHGNLPEVEDVLKLSQKLDVRFVKLSPISDVGRGKGLSSSGQLLEVQEIMSLVRFVEEELRVKYYPLRVEVALPPAFMPLKTAIKFKGACAYDELFSVLHDGSISFCGGFTGKWIMGHIQNVDLKELWENNEFLCEFREKIPESLEGVCAICIHRPHCQGACRNHAVSTYVSLTAPSPFCQTMYEAGLFPSSRTVPRRLPETIQMKWNEPPQEVPALLNGSSSQGGLIPVNSLRGCVRSLNPITG